MGHGADSRSDDVLLVAAREDPSAFAELYRRHVRAVVAFFARRTPGTDVAADLTAETFAAALAGRRSFDPERGEARGWLFGIAHRQLATYQRRGAVEARARRRLGMERLELDDAQLERIEAAVAADAPTAALMLDVLPDEQRGPVHARIVEEHSYARIAADSRVLVSRVASDDPSRATLVAGALGISGPAQPLGRAMRAQAPRADVVVVLGADFAALRGTRTLALAGAGGARGTATLRDTTGRQLLDLVATGLPKSSRYLVMLETRGGSRVQLGFGNYAKGVLRGTTALSPGQRDPQRVYVLLQAGIPETVVLTSRKG